MCTNWISRNNGREKNGKIDANGVCVHIWRTVQNRNEYKTVRVEKYEKMKFNLIRSVAVAQMNRPEEKWKKEKKKHKLIAKYMTRFTCNLV